MIRNSSQEEIVKSKYKGVSADVLAELLLDSRFAVPLQNAAFSLHSRALATPRCVGLFFCFLILTNVMKCISTVDAADTSLLCRTTRFDRSCAVEMEQTYCTANDRHRCRARRAAAIDRARRPTFRLTVIVFFGVDFCYFTGPVSLPAAGLSYNVCVCSDERASAMSSRGCRALSLTRQASSLPWRASSRPTTPATCRALRSRAGV